MTSCESDGHDWVFGGVRYRKDARYVDNRRVLVDWFYCRKCATPLVTNERPDDYGISAPRAGILPL